ncbi:MAG TPA: tetratricopeptide repeat protein [Bryobacteraceae bacterium]|nr:tetratricopeptide repeat protein [Bryobacteraceae bacterium]
MKPDYVRAHFNLASSLATLGRYADAAREFEAVLQLQPDFAEARKNLELCRQLQAEHHAR